MTPGTPPNAGCVSSAQPGRREPVPPIGQPHIDVLPTPAGRHRVDVFLAVVLPHDPGDDRYRRVRADAGAHGRRAPPLVGMAESPYRPTPAAPGLIPPERGARLLIGSHPSANVHGVGVGARYRAVAVGVDSHDIHGHRRSPAAEGAG
jgi:hypothetical protein